VHHHNHHHGSQIGSEAGREARGRNRLRLAGVLCLTAVYMLAEVIGGLLTGSLALLADAGHSASDVAALALSLTAIWIAQRPSAPQRTFGHTRAEILAALAQGMALAVVAALIVVEAFERLQSPSEVKGLGMALVASGGLAVNLAGMWILNRGRHESLNVRGAWMHVASDAVGSIGVIVAGGLIALLGWHWADPVASLLISGLVLFGAWQLLREAVDVLMETAPSHLDVNEIRQALQTLTGVDDVHDLHVWTIGSGEISLSSHAVAARGCEPGELLKRMQDLLTHRFNIAHATIQIEPHDADGACETGCEASSAATLAH
jgi:cobalt-zinc-cadmium efflux system protein